MLEANYSFTRNLHDKHQHGVSERASISRMGLIQLPILRNAGFIAIGRTYAAPGGTPTYPDSSTACGRNHSSVSPSAFAPVLQSETLKSRKIIAVERHQAQAIRGRGGRDLPVGKRRQPADARQPCALFRVP